MVKKLFNYILRYIQIKINFTSMLIVKPMLWKVCYMSKLETSFLAVQLNV